MQSSGLGALVRLVIARDLRLAVRHWDQVMQPLTRKEIAVLRLAAEGCSNSAMAERLALSDSTVRTHLRNINTKLDARSRSEAVAIARRLDLIR